MWKVNICWKVLEMGFDFELKENKKQEEETPKKPLQRSEFPNHYIASQIFT